MKDHAATLRPILMDVASDEDLPRTARLAAADAEGARDIEAVMARAGAAIVALETVGDVIAARAKALRAALLELMVETGAPSISTGTHTIGTQDKRRVHVTDPSLIPPSLMRQPPPAPDTEAIGRLLRNGGDVPGCALGNPVPTLTIRARSAK